MSDAGTNAESIYTVAIGELQQIADDDSYRRKVESGAIREARGQDILRLHATLKAVETAHDSLTAAVGRLQQELEQRSGSNESNVNRTRESVTSDVGAFREDVGSKFDRTWQALTQNFDSTNERTKREVFDLREEITRVLDRRFTHIDQTFASIRADIEVLKALQMELIKERIGRPELVKR